jgi:hypothetical protein
VIDVPTLKEWVTELGFDAEPQDSTTLRLHPRAPEDADVPPFFLQCTENWVLLSMLPMLDPDAIRPDGLARRLLSANRDMRVAKFALDKNGAIVLCAELPTESLDRSEIVDAATRMMEYARKLRAELGRRRSRVPPG